MMVRNLYEPSGRTSMRHRIHSFRRIAQQPEKVGIQAACVRLPELEQRFRYRLAARAANLTAPNQWGTGVARLAEIIAKGCAAPILRTARGVRCRLKRHA